MTLEELSNDSAFQEKLAQAQTPAEAVKILNEAGVEMTEAELQAMLDASEGELDEAAMEAVAGGYIKPGFGRWLWDKLFGKKGSSGGYHGGGRGRHG